MRAVRNLVAPPIVIITDSKEFAFNFPTRFRIEVSKLKIYFIFQIIRLIKIIDFKLHHVTIQKHKIN